MAARLEKPAENLPELIARETREKTELIHKEECYRIIGARFPVYKDKGSGFLEPVYDGCLAIELGLQSIPHVPKPRMQLSYKGQILRHHYEPDFVCFDKIILEIKAVTNLYDEHRAQILNYLAASGFQLGLQVNFGHYPKLERKGIASSKTNSPSIQPLPSLS